MPVGSGVDAGWDYDPGGSAADAPVAAGTEVVVYYDSVVVVGNWPATVEYCVPDPVIDNGGPD